MTAWQRAHQAVHRGCGGWEDWPAHQEYPVIEGTLIRLAVTRPAPGYAGLEPMWLWASDPDAGADEAAAATLWQAYLRRFDLEHTFRFLKSRLGWDRPLLRDPGAADRWTWLVIACYAQLCLARPLAGDIRLPWQRPQAAPGKPRVMTPGRVRAGFRLVRETVGTPASVAKPSRPAPAAPQARRTSTRHPATPSARPARKHAAHKRKLKTDKTDRLNGKLWPRRFFTKEKLNFWRVRQFMLQFRYGTQGTAILQRRANERYPAIAARLYSCASRGYPGCC